MTAKLKLIDENQIDKEISLIGTANGRFQNRIHKAAVSILKIWHDAKADDRQAAMKVAADRLTALQEATPYHRAKFAKWVEAMTPFAWANETKKYVGHVDDSQLMGKMFIAARDNPFHAIKIPTAPKPFDQWDAIEKLVKRIENRTAKPEEGDNVDVRALKYLREALKIADEPVVEAA